MNYRSYPLVVAVSHQTTHSKNHLITSSAQVRHNQSFDDTATNNPQQQQPPNPAATGYEEIPDSFSPVTTAPSASNQMIGAMQNQRPQGFNNMPSAAFQV